MKKEVKIKEMKFLNFKGLRDLTVDFNDKTTNIYGRNGSGKSTIFDGFTWLMFGKDSQDRKVFNIKTLDENGVAIPRIPHEVSAVLDVNGEEIEITRRYNEKWTKERNSATEKFTGHEEERLYNGVPCSVKEFNEKIDAICPENVFKFITSPLYFMSQKMQTQRDMIFRMAGGISEEDVAKGNEEFENLLKQLTGKSLEEYQREINAKKRRIKNEIESIPSRIDERKRDVPEKENWKALETELSEKVKERSAIKDQILDESKAYEQASADRMHKAKELNKVRSEKSELEYSIEEKSLKKYHAELSKKQLREQALENEKRTLFRYESDLKEKGNLLSKLSERRSNLIAEWKSIKANQLTFKEDEFSCPTCERPFEVDRIDSIREEVTNKFNTEQANKLDLNKQSGLKTKESIDTLTNEIKGLEELIAEVKKNIENLELENRLSGALKKPDVDYNSDKKYIDLCNKETDLVNQLEEEIEAPSNESLEIKESEVNTAIDELKKRLAKKETIDKNNQRINELETMHRIQSQELTELEGVEYIIQSFTKACRESMESKVDEMFEVVKFKLFDYQINGAEIETCEATVDGVPFSDLNSAGKINAGLDIINAISRFEGIHAPIFADNAESVNKLLATNSQMVRLVVTEDNDLIIE